MLIEFKLENFLSFKDEQILSMVAATKLSELKDHLIELDEDSFYLLKSASIFGANASGKSNLLTGLNAMRNITLNSVKNSQDDRQLADVSFALNPESKGGATKFEMTFFKHDTIYRYGFKILDGRIHAEWLFIDEVNVFSRITDKLDEYNRDYFRKEEIELKFAMTNKKSLFLTILASTNTEFAENILRYFKHDLNFLHGLTGQGSIYTKNALKSGDDTFKLKLLELLKQVDFSINNLEVKQADYTIGSQLENDISEEELPEELLEFIKSDTIRLLSEHNVYNSQGEIVGIHKFDSERYESTGTNTFLALAGPIVHTLENGGVLFIDEVDAQLHPLMTEYLLDLFNCKNNHKAQLIITSHNTTILNSKTQRRDQIWFVEKDQCEASHLTSLANYRFNGELVRKDENYAKNYLNGKYGAIPLIDRDCIDEFTNSI